MKRKQLVFIGCQILAFLIVTAIAGTIILCFPNPPSAVRGWLNKYRIDLQDSNKATKVPDRRFLEWFNRDPERHVPQEPRIVVAPADGFIQAVLKRNGYIHIVVEMRYTDVHVQRVPITGKVLSIEGGGQELRKGFRVMDYELDKMMPFQKITTFETEIGIVRVRQITSFFAKRIRVFLKEGQTYVIGTRLGNVLAGSTVVLEVPEVVTVLVKKDQDVIGGETIVARY